jgi:AmiR/NasT family two-component response regulator
MLVAVEEAHQRIEQLTTALEHRTRIAMALGILMERFDIDDGPAFDYLRRLSSHQNRKLYEIAIEVVETRGSVANPYERPPRRREGSA